MPISDRPPSAPPPSGAQGVKGSLLVHLRTFVERELGPVTWSRVVAKLRPADREILSGLVLVQAWLPVGVWNRALNVFLRDNYPDPMAGMVTLARFIADSDLNTLFRLVLKAGSPDFILGRTGSLYNRYFQAGTFVPQKLGPRHWTATLTVSRHEDVGPGIFSCEAGICSWLTQALELSGAQPKTTHPKCRFQRSPYCQYDLTW